MARLFAAAMCFCRENAILKTYTLHIVYQLFAVKHAMREKKRRCGKAFSDTRKSPFRHTGKALRRDKTVSAVRRKAPFGMPE